MPSKQSSTVQISLSIKKQLENWITRQTVPPSMKKTIEYACLALLENRIISKNEADSLNEPWTCSNCQEETTRPVFEERDEVYCPTCYRDINSISE